MNAPKKIYKYSPEYRREKNKAYYEKNKAKIREKCRLKKQEKEGYIEITIRKVKDGVKEELWNERIACVTT